MSETYDVIVVGSGAGGAAAAWSLVQAGRRVLILERGEPLPRDGSTLDVRQVFGEGRFRNSVPWVDRDDQPLHPDEYYNVGGKTKWYGAALLRFSPHEFEPDIAFACPGWPIDYVEMAPFYAQAETLLGVRHFKHETGLRRLIARLGANGSDWHIEALPLGLKPEILEHPAEARHFDGFASPGGYKADAEHALLQPMLEQPHCTLMTGKEVTDLQYAAGVPSRITGVRCADGSHYQAHEVILAAGAMTSPRLLQRHLERTGLDETLPCAALVGAHLKLHLNSALLAFSPRHQHDLLRKTALFRHDAFPHSSVQPLGWLDGEILATQLPRSVPRFLSNALGARAVGFFLTTEDGSHSDNRVVAPAGGDGPPRVDYSLDRIPASREEHRALTRAFQRRLLAAGFVSAARPMGLAGTAHALGTLIAGRDPARSVVDAHGRVHGMQHLHVADGSVLARSSRVNPALTIYAWGLRLGEHLAGEIRT
jgi:choline dehydrogenase-like flavoprotein